MACRPTHVAGSPPIEFKATRQRMSRFSAAFADIRHSIEDLAAEGDRVALRSRLEMTHTGEYVGAAGSDNKISVVEMGFMRIAEGKIAEMWGLLDTLGIMRQTGAMTASG